MDLSAEARLIFNDRYAMKNDRGEILETPDDAVQRISEKAAASESIPDLVKRWTEEFKYVIDHKWFLPSTPIWSNMGKPDRMQQPGACFVLALQDDLEDMYKTLMESALISKYGGGIGYNFSEIRPRGDLIHSTKGRASGVVELIKLYDFSAAMVSQAGIRRGAYMGILNCDHPEIEDFISCKLSGGLNNFNISVGISDDFMRAVINNDDWMLRFKGQLRKTVKARQLWEAVVKAAWSCGDPGLVFLDSIERANPIPNRPMNCTNPCGEQPLSPGESCLLGSINLSLMLDEKHDAIDWARLGRTARVAVRFLDNMIDQAQYPFDFIAHESRASRKIGIGVMGLHDLLLMLGLSYDSPAGVERAAQIIGYIRETVDQATADLGQEKGNFPLWHDSVYAADQQPRRNASCLTIAPTGTISLLAGVEGYGIEPIFAVAYKKVFHRDGIIDRLDFFSPLFVEVCQKRGVTQPALRETAARGSCQGVEGIPADLQRLFRGAQEIDPVDHLAMQVAIQKSVDNAISKTINLPATVEIELVAEIYMKAWKHELKGISVFRAGSKAGVIEIGYQTTSR